MYFTKSYCCIGDFFLLPSLSYSKLVCTITSDLINIVMYNVPLQFFYSYKLLNSATVGAQITRSWRLTTTLTIW